MRPNRVLAVFAAVLALIGIVVAVAARNGQKSFDPSTPEYAVQKFLSAVVERDSQEAAKYLSSDTRCTINDLDRAYTPEDVSIDLVSSEIESDQATVKVTIAMGNDGPFGSVYSEAHTYRLTRSDRWLITGTPWPLYDCGVYKP